MAQDKEIELRSNVSKQIRDRLVGRIFSVKLKDEKQASEVQPKGFFRKISSRVVHRPQIKDQKQDAAVLLNVESVEVYTESAGDAHTNNDDRSEHSAHSGPQLHAPPPSLEGHVYSYSISMSQVLRVAQTDADVTVFFHPNIADSVQSPDLAASFTCEFGDPEEAGEFVTGLQSVLEQFAHAMLHIGQRYTLQEKTEILAIAQGPLSQGRDPWQSAQQSSGPEAETVIARAPEWGTDHSMPPSWSAPGGSEEALFVYMCTPLGPALAQITEQHLLKGRAERDGSFNVRAVLPQHTEEERESHTIHRDCSQSRLSSAFESASLRGVISGSNQKETRTVTLFCQIVDNSGKLLTRRSLSLRRSLSTRRSSSMQWQPSASLDPGPAKGVQLKQGGITRQPKQVAAGWLSTKRVLAVLFLLGPWLVQLADQAGLLHHPQSHLVHALINVFSALWAVAVVGIALNGGLADLHHSSPAGAASGPQAEPEGFAQSIAPPPPSDVRIKLIKAEVEEQWGGGKAAADTAQLGELQDVEDEESSEEEDSEDMPCEANDWRFAPDIVARFEEGYRNNDIAAKDAMRRTYEWRRKIDGFNMLEQPQQHFELFKGFFDHGVMAMTRKKHPVWVIKAGMMREGWKKYQKSSATDRDVARHICFTHDFMYNVLDTSPLPGGRTIWINDLKGIGMRDVGSKPMEFGLQMMGLVEKYYPERLDKAFVVNVPGFFHILWRIVQPLIPQATKKRLFVMRSVEELHKNLLEEIEDEHIPVEYGGKETRHLYETEHELALRQLVKKLSNDSKAS